MARTLKKEWKHFKRRTKFAVLRRIVLPVLLPLVKLWMKSYRVDSNIADYNADLYNRNQPLVLAALHGQAFCAIGTLMHFHDSVSVVTMVSPSRDGDLIDYAIRHFGQETVRGSSSKGGKTALLTLRGGVKQGKIPLLAVDGPRGPRTQPSGGAIALARVTRAKLVLMVATAKPAFCLPTWDRFLVPLPFARITVRFVTVNDFATPSGKKDIAEERAEFQKVILNNLHELGEETDDVIPLGGDRM